MTSQPVATDGPSMGKMWLNYQREMATSTLSFNFATNGQERQLAFTGSFLASPEGFL